MTVGPQLEANFAAIAKSCGKEIGEREQMIKSVMIYAYRLGYAEATGEMLERFFQRAILEATK